MKGKGSLSDLKCLKAKYKERFKHEAPKIKKIDKWCFRLRCDKVINPRRFKHAGGRLHLDMRTCTRKRCIREAVDEYKRMLKLTRAWRKDKGHPITAKIWWGIIKKERDKLRGRLK